MRLRLVITRALAGSLIAGAVFTACRAETAAPKATPDPAPVGSAASPLVGTPGSPAAADKPAANQAPASAAAKAPRPTKFAPVAVPVPGESGAAPKTVWLDPHEVTVGDFKKCVDAGGCKKEHFVIQADSTCNYDAKGREEHPMNCVDYFGAEAYCQGAGGRLCKEEEWFAGCRGPSQQDYPYGNTYQAGACNALSRGGPIADRGTSEVASYPSCEGGYAGIYDMVGNVAEWLDSCKGDYCHFYGGAFLENDPVEDFSSCKRFCAGNQKSFRSSTIGFRCCYDAEPKAAKKGR